MGSHQYYRQMLPLLLYGDLSEQETQELEQHLAACAECRREFNGTRKLHSFLSRTPLPGLTEDALREARVQFRAALAAERRRRSLWEWVRDLFPASLSLRPITALTGLVLIALGVLTGRFVLPRDSNSVTGDADFMGLGGGIRVTNVHLLAREGQAGEIEMTYDAIRPVRIRGTLDDAAIQRVLAHALVSGENAGVRIRAANSVLATQSAAPEREIKAALLLALKSDQNDGVRREAMRALLRFPADSEVRDALLYVVLHDPNPGVRIGAINGLDTLRIRGYQPDEAQRATFRQVVQNDKNLYVRVKAQSILEEKIQ